MDAAERLVAKLRQLGVLRSRAVEEALEGLPPRSFTRGELRAFAHLDIPWPEPGDVDFTLSPRLSVLLAELCEPQGAQRVLLQPRRHGLLAALLESRGTEVDTKPRGMYDRVVVVDGDWDLEDAARTHVADGGFLLRVRLDAFGEGIVKYVRSGSGWVRMGLNQVRLTPNHSLKPGHEARGEPLENLLVVEGIERRAWHERSDREEDTYYRDAVDRTWSPRFVQNAGSPKEAADRLLLAKKFFHLGYINQSVGDLANAAELYAASIESFPSAEAYTFRSWVLAMTGRLDEAIEGCRKAIEVDAEFGNAYNDLGAYLLEKAQAAEALRWLERAKTATRYDARHYAYTNAGRAHLMLGQRDEARTEFRIALRLQPEYEPARRLLEMAR